MEVASNRRFNDKQDGRHVGTRTPDLYRVNYAVQTLKPFSFLAFSLSASSKIRLEKPSFGDELVTSFHVPPTGAKPVVGVIDISTAIVGPALELCDGRRQLRPC